MPRFRFITAALLAVSLAVPAAAQFTERTEFFKALRDRDGAKVQEILAKPGSTIVNAKDRDSGETALHIVTERRDTPYMLFMIARGADVNARNDEGETPLMIASSLGFAEGIRNLLARGARTDIANGRGETPLIRAVQRRDAAAVRLLLAAGADPDQSDYIAGMSARDYAARDGRARHIAKLIEETEADPAEVFGPTR